MPSGRLREELREGELRRRVDGRGRSDGAREEGSREARASRISTSFPRCYQFGRDGPIWLRAYLARGALGVAESLRAGHRSPEIVAPRRGQGPEQTQELLGARHRTNESPRLKTEGATVGRTRRRRRGGFKISCSIFAIPAEPRLGSAPFLRVLFARSNLASTQPSSRRSIPPRIITPRRATPRGPPRRQPPPPSSTRRTRRDRRSRFGDSSLTFDRRQVRTRP